MKYRLIIFDFDGTLADSFQWFAGAINQLADRYKFNRIAPGEHEMLRGCDARAILKYLRVPLWKTPRIASHMRTLMNRDIERISSFPGVGQALRRLAQQGAQLGMVSSNSNKNIQLILGAENAGLFTYRECGVSIFGKAAQLRKILRTCRIPPPAAIYIGDELRDLDAARAVGIKFGAVAWGYTRLEALKAQAPDEIFLRVEALSADPPPRAEDL